MKLLKVDENGEGLRLKGLVLDGDNKLDTLVSIFGGCKAGIILEDLILQGFTRSRASCSPTARAAPPTPFSSRGSGSSPGNPAKVDIYFNASHGGTRGSSATVSSRFKAVPPMAGPRSRSGSPTRSH